MVSFVLNLFVIVWIWFTIRLKTKFHNAIRIVISLLFFVINMVFLVLTYNDPLLKEDKGAFWLFIIFCSIFAFLFFIRLLSDVYFVSQNKFEPTEKKLKEKIKEKLHLG